MNKVQLKKCVGSRIRLRPSAISVRNRRVIAQRDDIWIVLSVNTAGVAELSNISTGHVAKLGQDHIHHFDSDPQSQTDGLMHGFFNLTVQVFMNTRRLWVEPLARLGVPAANQAFKPTGHKKPWPAA